jgi:D-alanyl-D-alanine carboxypeptidase
MSFVRALRWLQLLCCIALFFGLWPSAPLPVAQAQVPNYRDFGDAPDSTNQSSSPMTAYPGVNAQFPVSRLPSGEPTGPFHINEPLSFYLGNEISGEEEAESGMDEDPVNNIRPAYNLANDDNDDGLYVLSTLKHCTSVTLKYRVTVTNNATLPQTAYINLWADWNRDGAWGANSGMTCADGSSANEWAVQNHAIRLTEPGSFVFELPAIKVWNEQHEQDMWLRFSISEQEATHADGRGPAAGYAHGETEDYLLEGWAEGSEPEVLPELKPLDLTAIPSYTLYMPLVVAPTPAKPDITAPLSPLREVDVVHIGGAVNSSLRPLIITASGTGASVKLSSWTMSNNNSPTHLQDSPIIHGYDVKLYALTPSTSSSSGYSLLLSAVRDAQQNLWLTTWRVNNAGEFTKLDTRGYGSNAKVQVLNFSIAHRSLLSRTGSLDAFQVVTPIIGNVAENGIRIITWRVNPTTGAIVGLKDSGSVFTANPNSLIEIAALEGNADTPPYYVVVHRTALNNQMVSYWRVDNSGLPTIHGSGLTGVSLRGTGTVVRTAEDMAIAPLARSGFFSVDNGTNPLRTTTWETRPAMCNIANCSLRPYVIADHTLDQNPGKGVTITDPTVNSQRALLVDTRQSYEFEKARTLYQRGSGIQGIASVTKVMTLIIALRAVENNQVSLDDMVTVSANAVSVSGSLMGLTQGERQTLRTLLHGLIINSGNDAAFAIAEHISGTTTAFATEMNNLAASLGMSNSTYCQPAGGCFSNTADQVRLWMELRDMPGFQEFAGSSQYSACGTFSNNTPSCYNLSRSVGSRYPGLESWKGGSRGFFCDTVPNVPLCASSGCLSLQATRLDHTLVLNQLHSQSSTVAVNRWTDAYNILDYGFRLLFTPDLRGEVTTQVGAVKDYAIDNVGGSHFVTAVATSDGKLKLCGWNLLVANGTLNQIGCTERSFTTMPTSNTQALNTNKIDVVQVPLPTADGGYVSARFANNALNLRMWTVAQQP